MVLGIQGFGFGGLALAIHGLGFRFLGFESLRGLGFWIKGWA